MEVLIAGAMGAVLLTALSASTGVFFDSYADGLDKQDLNLANHIAMERLLKSITNAAVAKVTSTNSLELTFPNGGTEKYAWSEQAGDPLLFFSNQGSGIDFVDNVFDLTFTPTIAQYFQETLEAEIAPLLSFEDYTGYSQEWEDHPLFADNRHGFMFVVDCSKFVERIELTQIQVRIGKLAGGHTSDLKVSLYQTMGELKPCPWGNELAHCIIPNSEIPPVTYPYGQLDVPWMTISLPPEFLILPSRYYCLLFEKSGGTQAGYLRVARINGGGNGPNNNMAYMGSNDGGVSWDPPCGSNDYHLRDVPVYLEGTIYNRKRKNIQYVAFVDVALTMGCGKEIRTECGRARVRGGGSKR